MFHESREDLGCSRLHVIEELRVDVVEELGDGDIAQIEAGDLRRNGMV